MNGIMTLFTGFGIIMPSNTGFKSVQYGFSLNYITNKTFNTEFVVYTKLLKLDLKIGWLSKKVLSHVVYSCCAVEIILNANVSR